MDFVTFYQNCKDKRRIKKKQDFMIYTCFLFFYGQKVRNKVMLKCIDS